MEVDQQGFNLGWCKFSSRKRHGQFIALAYIAHIYLAQEVLVLVLHPFFLQYRPPLLFHIAERCRHLFEIQLIYLAYECCRIIVLEICHEQAQRRSGSRTHRNQSGRNLHFCHQAIGMYRACPAEGHQHEFSRIVSPLNRNQPKGVDHGRVGDFHNPVGGFYGIQSQRVSAFLLNRHLSGFCVQCDLTA